MEDTGCCRPSSITKQFVAHQNIIWKSKIVKHLFISFLSISLVQPLIAEGSLLHWTARCQGKKLHTQTAWKLTVTKASFWEDLTNELAKRTGDGMETKPYVKVTKFL